MTCGEHEGSDHSSHLFRSNTISDDARGTVRSESYSWTRAKYTPAKYFWSKNEFWDEVLRRSMISKSKFPIRIQGQWDTEGYSEGRPGRSRAKFQLMSSVYVYGCYSYEKLSVFEHMLNSYIEKKNITRRGEEMGEHPSGRLIDSFTADIMSKPSHGYDAVTATVCSLSMRHGRLAVTIPIPFDKMLRGQCWNRNSTLPVQNR